MEWLAIGERPCRWGWDHIRASVADRAEVERLQPELQRLRRGIDENQPANVAGVGGVSAREMTVGRRMKLVDLHRMHAGSCRSWTTR
uniref:Uncharacterized protein n=1 Tax=Arundo donax TaxID=35708 RepID=A0A0A8ZCT3_ARUDO